MHIIIESHWRHYVFEVPPHIPIYELKRLMSRKLGRSFMESTFMWKGGTLDDESELEDYNIKDGDRIRDIGVINGGGSENDSYLIKGSNEGSVWGDGIYTDDSNIAKAAVLEGKCQLGEEKLILIKIVEGKSSYSSISKNGVSSSSWGSWDGSNIFV